MTDQAPQAKAANAWLIIHPGPENYKFPYPQFALELAGDRSLYAAVARRRLAGSGDASGGVTRIARVLRVRSDLKTTTFTSIASRSGIQDQILLRQDWPYQR